MRTASYRLSDLQKFTIPLGFVGENEHCQIIFLADEAYAEYPHAAVSLTVRPPYGEPYPAVVTRDGNNVLWTIKDSDLTRSGQGEIQLSFTTGEVVAKTYVGKTKVCRSIVPTGDVPDPIDDFLTEAGAALTAIPETIAHEFEAIQAVAQTLEPGSQATAHFDGETKQLEIGVPEGEKGEPGYTPQRGVDYWTEADQAAMRQDIASDTAAARQAIADDKAAAELAITQDKNAAQQAISEDRAAAITAIGNKGTEQVGAVTNKGAEVLASIPSDYTELSEDVSGLKSAINVNQADKTVGEYNLFNKNSLFINHGKYLNSSGELKNGQSYVVSHYIKVKPSTAYIGKDVTLQSGVYLAEYDKDFNLVQTAVANLINGVSYTMSATTEYIRITLSEAFIDGTMIVEGTTVPTIYADSSGLEKEGSFNNKLLAANDYYTGKATKGIQFALTETYTNTGITSVGQIDTNTNKWSLSQMIALPTGSKTVSELLKYEVNSRANVGFFKSNSLIADNYISAYGFDTDATEHEATYTVPDGAKYVVFAMRQNSENKNSVICAYISGFDPDAVEEISEAEADAAVEGFKNDLLLSNQMNPSECVAGKYLRTYSNQTIQYADNANYNSSGLVPAKAGNTYYLFDKQLTNVTAIYVCEYGEDKKLIRSSMNASSITAGTGTHYLAFSWSALLYDVNDVMCVDDQYPDKYYTYGKSEIRSEYLSSEEVHVYLPPEICVGVGRTIELYNELVCLEAKKYHLDWVCSVGVDYARKWSVTGTVSNIGTYTLTLNIYNDNLAKIKTVSTTVKIIADSLSGAKYILPIGDSLTNNKAWLSEVQSLADSNIVYVGTRGDAHNSYKHEGRSGITSGWCNGNNSYTFDNNYVGNPSVSASANPFWDGTGFSLSHYLETQGSYLSGTPDAVQLLLGTNGIALDPSNNVTQIKAIVDSIRSEYATLPIFVCNTIYRSNQDGYYSSGNDGYTSASDFQYSADMKVMNLQNALAETFEDYSNVFIIPLSVCMDREYDFGSVEVSVNPRLTTVKTTIPVESVHPQTPGYYQMADVMYSSYIAHLT